MIHLVVAYLQIVVGLIAGSIVMGKPLPDLVVKFGGAKAGEKQDNFDQPDKKDGNDESSAGSGARVMPTEGPDVESSKASASSFVRPSHPAIKSDFKAHVVLGIVNLATGVLALMPATESATES